MGDTLLAYLHKDDVSTSFLQSLTELLATDDGVHVGEITNIRCNAGDVPLGRNQAMRYFLEGEFDWLFFVDTDMGFTPTSLGTLHSVADPTERPIVGGLCFAQRDLMRDGRNGYRWEPRPTIFEYKPFPDGKKRFAFRTHYPVNAVMPCEGTGAAFLLIHKSVGARMLNEYGPVWFDRIQDPDGSLLSEDLSFFKRWMDLHGPSGCHIHTGVRTTHLKPIWMAEPDFWAIAAVLPATERVDVIVPVLHRPQNVKPFMETLTASTGLATAWFVVEPGDIEEIDEVIKYGGKVVEHAGTFAQKMNYGYKYSGKRSPAPYVFMVGDDVIFQPGWLDHAEFVADYYKADVIGTNDLGSPRVIAGDHATHLLIRRSYVDQVGASWDGPGTVCHEYGHQFVDDEIVAAAQQRGVWQMALGSLVEHLHPYWNKADDDDIYRKGRETMEADRAAFEARAAEYGAVA